MKPISGWLWLGCAVLLAGGLAAAFGLAGAFWEMMAALLLGVGWIAADWAAFRGLGVYPQPDDRLLERQIGAWSGSDAAGLALFCGLTGWGLLSFRLPAWLALLAVLVALAAWDLGRLMRRLGVALDLASIVAIERRHLARLGLTLGGGALLGGLALVIRIPLDFWPAVALAAVAVLVLSRMARVLK